MALRTFMPRVCTVWNAARPLCTTGAATPALRAVVLLVAARTAWERHRVWRRVVVAGRAAAAGERERARREDVRDLLADRAVEERIGRLAIVFGGVWVGERFVRDFVVVEMLASGRN